MLKFRKFAIHCSFDHTRYFTKKELMQGTMGDDFEEKRF